MIYYNLHVEPSLQCLQHPQVVRSWKISPSFDNFQTCPVTLTGLSTIGPGHLERRRLVVDTFSMDTLDRLDLSMLNDL